MAEQNTTSTPTGGQQNNGLSKEIIEQLKKMAVTAHNLWGLPPCASEWILTADQIKKIVRQQAEAFLDDIKYITLEGNSRSGAIDVYVWVPKNSRNVMDNTLKESGSAISKPMRRFSSKMKEFMGKYCNKNEQRLITDANGGPNVGIKIQCDTALKIFFDENGTNYQKVYKEKGHRKMVLLFKATLKEKDNDHTYSEVVALKVRKGFQNDSMGEPKAQRSYNAR